MTAGVVEVPSRDGEHHDELLLSAQLLYVSGKGGAGKTTVSGALGVAAARRRRRVLVCDLARSGQFARAFGRSGAGELQLAPNLWSLSLDPEVALGEWLRRQPGGAAAAAVLTHSRGFRTFVAAAPGAKEIVTVGKLVDLTARSGREESSAYDLVIADGPSTGHALAMLTAPKTIGDLATLGPVGADTRAVRDFLANSASTAYVGVSLPEELALHEVLELERGLRDALGRELELIVVNRVCPERFTDEEAERLRELAERTASPAPLHAALAEHRRARIHAARVEWLRERARAPVATLPFLSVPALGPAEYGLLARVIRSRAD